MGGGEAKSKRYVLRRLLKVATEVAERTDSGRLFQREWAQELKAVVPVLVLTILLRATCCLDLYRMQKISCSVPPFSISDNIELPTK